MIGYITKGNCLWTSFGGKKDTQNNIIPVASGAKRKRTTCTSRSKVLCAFACTSLAPMDNICEKYVEHLVFTEQKSHRQISEILKSSYPNQKGLSERSVRRFCKEERDFQTGKPFRGVTG